MQEKRIIERSDIRDYLTDMNRVRLTSGDILRLSGVEIVPDPPDTLTPIAETQAAQPAPADQPEL